MDIITIKADIHPDGDIYVLCKDGKTYQRIGCIGESTFSNVPDRYYEKIKKIAKLFKR